MPVLSTDGLFAALGIDWRIALGILLLALPMVNYSSIAIASAISIRSSKVGREPPTIPYWIPFLGSLVPIMQNAIAFTQRISGSYGESVPISVRIGPLRSYLISTPESFLELTKASRYLTPKPGISIGMKNLFGTTPSAFQIYYNDDSGIGQVPIPGTNIAPENRIWFKGNSQAHKWLSGKSLQGISQRFMEFLARDIAQDKSIGDEWIEMPDLFSFWQERVFKAAVSALFGPHLLRLNPDFTRDFWAFISDTPSLMMGLPRWLTPGTYSNRDKVLAGLKKWQKYACDHSDYLKTGPTDPDWDEYWGSTYLKARYTFRKEIPAMDEDAYASDDLALLVAANANAIISSIWFLLETLRVPSLIPRVRAELDAASRPSTSAGEVRFDIDALCAQPLLQSIYAETLRLRMGLLVNRTSQREEVRLGPWKFRANSPICLSSMTAATNKNLWNDMDGQRPLETFWADRFVVYPDDPTSGPLKKKTLQQAKELAVVEDGGADKSHSPVFSIEGTAGGWVPYGMGRFMCPGRFLAKQEMIGSFAVFFNSYEVELRVPKDWEPQVNLKFFGTGAMPPLGKAPFRIRKKAGKKP